MITELVSTAPGFQTSVNIAYDLNNPEKIKRLIPTTAALKLFEDFLLSTNDNSCNRARILVGAYGKGKSHIVLSVLSILCKLAANSENGTVDIDKVAINNASLLAKVKTENPELFEYAQEYLKSEKRLLPVIINGSNTSLIQSFMGALYNTLKHNDLMAVMPDTHFQAAINKIEQWKREFPDTWVQFQKAVNMPVDEFTERLANFDVEAYASFENVYPTITSGSEFNPFAGFDVIELYQKVIEKLPEFGYTGIFVVYDEFSKYLESSITKASISDTTMLQSFAEKCNDSGSKQLHLLLITHKQIENYIDVLPSDKVDGWRGISGRFTHVQMHSDFSQTYEIVSQAIVKNSELWPTFYGKYANVFLDIKARFAGHLMFADCDSNGLDAAVVGCYPLHPVTTFMLPRLSEKVAQNERTLFTFISGQGPATLTDALKTLREEFPLVTPDVLYDYFAPQMKKEVYTSEIYQLHRLTSRILAKLDENSLHAKIVKAISLIYCLGQFERLAPTENTIISIYSSERVSAAEIASAIADLARKECVVFLKRSNAYLKLKESSGVDVHKAIADTVQKRSSNKSVAALLDEANLEPYAYPTRYNDSHEITRFFQFAFIDAEHLLQANSLQAYVDEYSSDGVIFGVVTHNERQIELLKTHILSSSAGVKRAVFVLPTEHGRILADLQVLDAVQHLREHANGDTLLFDEYDMIYQDRSEVVHRFISQYTHPEAHKAKYYYDGEECALYRKAHLSNLLSQICDNVYANTPVINNEVINKNKLTTVAQNSRTRLLTGLLANTLTPNLGLMGSSQDVSFMRSTLITTGILMQDGDNVSINLSPADEKLSGVLSIIDNFFDQTKTAGVTSFDTLYQRLTGPEHGIGMRKGIIPIYVAAVLRKYHKNAVICDQYGEVNVTPTLLNEINENPSDYSVKIEDWSDTKESYIDALSVVFADQISEADRVKAGYGYLTIAMGRWYLSLPKYTKELKTVYIGANNRLEVDSEKRKFMALLKQPSIGALDLLFTRIPKCFGLGEATPDLAKKVAETKRFYDSVKSNLEEALAKDMKVVFGGEAPTDATLPSIIKDWCENLTATARNKVYPDGAERIFRVFDSITSNEHLLVEGLARVLTGLRIEDWNDSNIDVFAKRLAEYKATIDKESEETQIIDSAPSTAIVDQCGYSVVFVDKNGNAAQRVFDRVERSKRSDALYRRIESAIREMGHSITPQEKRQVLMEILEKLC